VRWGVTEEPICTDLSGTYGTGYESCNGFQYKFLAQFSFMEAYSSDNSKPVHKIELLEAA